VEANLTNMLVIAETSSFLLINQNVNVIVKAIKPYLPQTKPSQSTAKTPDLKLVVSGCFLQIPTGSEQKNSLFI
jgi:hypothetical protein